MCPVGSVTLDSLFRMAYIIIGSLCYFFISKFVFIALNIQ